MASGIIKFLKKYVCVQTAVYWECEGTDAYGNVNYSDPVELSVRWDEQTELIRDNWGKEVASKAQVQVLQDLKVDGWLYLGSLSELSSSEQDDPVSIANTYKVIRFDKNPLFNSISEYVRTVYL